MPFRAIGLKFDLTCLMAVPSGSGVASISTPFQRQRRGIETKLAYGHEPHKVDTVQLRRVARGYAWLDEIRSGRATFKEIVMRENLSRRLVAIHLDLAFLAPDLVRLIVDGQQRSSLSAQAFRSMQMPREWEKQRALVAPISSRRCK